MRQQNELNTYDEVKEKALNLLEFRSHSEKELRDKLTRYGAKREHTDEVLDFCRRYGFVNDEQYAKSKARDLYNLKKFGLRRIRSELKSKGIDDYLTEQAIEELNLDDFDDKLKTLVEKKLKGDFSIKNINKCLRYFMYRGYDLSDIRSCIHELNREDNGDFYEL